MPDEAHDLDLGDSHWLDWSRYEGERGGGMITHTTDKTESGFCYGSFTIRGSKWNIAEPKYASWEFNGSFDVPTLSPSFLCHCGDHGFIREGKWVRA